MKGTPLAPSAAGKRGDAPTRPSGDSDRSLIQRARAGDAGAFEDLVRLHSPSVFRVAAGLVGPDEAEDVVQEVFIVAHERLAEFQGRSALRTWLCGIGAKKSLQRLRRRRRVSWFGLGSAPEQTSHVTPEAITSAEERGEAVRAAIARLPADQRAVVVLRTFEGLSFPQIASALGIRLPTAESRMARAREKLRGLLSHLEREDSSL